jgi:site-specific DNA-methyltransferase (adenine-specific)
MMSKQEKPAAIYMSIDDLYPAPDNPRVNDHVVDKIVRSIQLHGFAAPIVSNMQGEILAGHTRWKAAKKLNMLTVPVRQINLTGDQAKLYRIADNKLSEFADWDEDMLKEQLADLEKAFPVDVGDLFSDDELEELLVDKEEIEIDEGQDYTNENEHDDFDQPTESRFKTGHVEEVGRQKIICGDCIQVLKSMPDNSVDSVVCDPPYQIFFMSKSWDQEFDTEEWARQCLRVLKPGGHLIAFAATRTIHKIMYSLENQGFEIRDLISWLYFSGFPKSHNVSKAIDKHFGVEREVVGERTVAADQWTGKKQLEKGLSSYGIPVTKPATKEAIKFDGWGTALKPAQEPAVLCRKPLEKGLSIAENVLKWGTGGLNIDACRFGYGDPCWVGPQEAPPSVPQPSNACPVIVFDGVGRNGKMSEVHNLGRWPANIYQCPKASRGEREEGLEDHESKTGHETVNRKEGSAGLNNPRAGAGRTASEVKNFHPTVKPVKLMGWLVRLVTPIDGIVVDTFCGSGTTLVATELEGKYQGIGIEMNPEYCDIIFGRVKHASKKEE